MNQKPKQLDKKGLNGAPLLGAILRELTLVATVKLPVLFLLTLLAAALGRGPREQTAATARRLDHGRTTHVVPKGHHTTAIHFLVAGLIGPRLRRLAGTQRTHQTCQRRLVAAVALAENITETAHS